MTPKPYTPTTISKNAAYRTLKKLTMLLLLIAAFCLFTAEANAQENWTYCASENNRCSFSGTKQVIYGSNGSYFTGTFSNGVTCSNSVFGDPISGYVKECFYLDTTSTNTTNSTANWTYCASESNHCSFSGTKEVRYGANGSYSSGVFSNGVACSNSIFGDPISGYVKECYYHNTSSSTTTTSATTTSSTANWTYCASESNHCSFSGTKEVRYGANGSYSSGIFSNGVACSNSVFGDPISGYVKECYFHDTSSSTTTTSATTTSSTANWTYCASESNHCSFSGTKEVRYGANGSYSSGIFSGGVACSNSVFGDPISGYVKECYYHDTSSSTNTTTTGPTPTNTTGTTYYVAKTGSDSYSCDQAKSASTAKLTIVAGIGCLSGGEILKIKPGTYQERIYFNVTANVPAGTASSPTTIISDGGTVTVKCPVSGANLYLFGVVYPYITIDSITLDGDGRCGAFAMLGNGTTPSVTHHVKLQNSQIINTFGDAVFMGDADDSAVINTTISNVTSTGNGSNGIYSFGQRNLIEKNRIYDIDCYGIHFYDGGYGTSRSNIVRNNLIHDTSKLRLCGGMIAGGADHLIYNNVIHNDPYIGIRVQYSEPTNSRIYNNTVYNAGHEEGGIHIGPDARGIVVKNNIVYNVAAGIINQGSNSSLSNNLLPPNNPRFVDAANGNFTLQQGSPAIDTGVPLNEVPVDFNGTSRPQGGGYNIGAFE